MKRQFNKLYPVYCAWCPGEKKIVGYKSLPNSHGICPECADKLKKETQAYKNRMKAA